MRKNGIEKRSAGKRKKSGGERGVKKALKKRNSESGKR